MSTQAPDADLAWLNRTLTIDPDDGAFVADPGREITADGDATLLALPARGGLQRLVPARGSAASGAFVNVHDGMSARRRGAGRLARWGARFGAVGLVFRRRIVIPRDIGLGGDPERSVLASLGSRFPRAASMAITLGPPRANRKPVVQLLDDRGTTVAFAKVGADDTTALLVANEADWLARLDGGRGVLRVPRLLDRFEWQGMPVAVIEPIDADGHDPDFLDDQRVERLSALISFDAHDVTLGEAIARWPDPIGVPDHVAIRYRTRRDQVVERHGSRLLAVAPWHGDLTPWNTITTAATTAVLDWEFACDHVPSGLDLVHRRVMVDTHLRDVADATALSRARQSVDDPARWAAYLLLLAGRDQPLGRAAADELRRAFEE